MSDDYIQEENTTVCMGELLEDMTDTVQRTKKMYCDVHIPSFFAKGYSHPLTYVPFYALSLPLKKGDKVLVAFKDGDYNLPYIYKNPNEIDEGFYKQFDFQNGVAGGKVTMPDSKKTVSAIKVGEESLIIKTDDYTVIRQNNGVIVIDKNNKVYIQGNEINITTSGKCNIDCNNECIITAKAGFTVNNHLKVNP